MDITADRIWADFRILRETTPLVLSLTNSVVREFTANALLGLGASPIMSDAFEEIAEERRGEASLVFTAHSVPVAMAQSSAYEQQLRES